MLIPRTQSRAILKTSVFLFLIFSLCLSQGSEKEKNAPPYQEKEFKPVPASLMDDLIKKSEEYERHALKFICTEMIRHVSYNVTEGEAVKEKRETYEYLLESDPYQGKLVAYRQKMTGTGSLAEKSKAELEYNFPEAYSWIFIFSKNFRNMMKYGYIGKEISTYKLAHIIAFRGFQPFSNGKDIREWEGKIWVEERTCNILKVEAEPIHQSDILELKRQEYNQAFSFIGIRFKKRPLGHSALVYFDLEQESLTFPTESRNSTFELIAKGKKAPTSALILNYADYHFFKTDSKSDLF